MCGIAGYVHLQNNASTVDPLLLFNMQEAIAHRGPNGYGIWSSDELGIGLVNRRLSIIDLSEAGNQPMMDQDKSVIVVYNGEIYNHKALRKELEALGYVYNSNTDTETILYAYKAWGIDCINRFEGMFAFALVDFISDEIYFVRDRMGVKPLYFSTQSNIFSFASEIKALWGLPWMEKSLNTTALSHYLTLMATPAPLTIYEGVYKLPAGYYAKLDSVRNLTFKKWYCPITNLSQLEKENYNDERWCVDKIGKILRSSVKKRLMSDVPLGVFLSGGIDSSLIVALMSEFTDKVKTFNVSFDDDPKNNESKWARKVADKFKTEHFETVIGEKDAFDFFLDMVYYQDEPLGDCVCIPFYYVSKLLKNSGVTVVLLGEGADELFCGYTLYGNYLNIAPHYYASQKLVPNFAKKTVAKFAKSIFKDKQGYLSVIDSWAENKELFMSGAIAFSDILKSKIYNEKQKTITDPIVDAIFPGMYQGSDSYRVIEYYMKEFKTLDPHADILKQMIYLELKHRLPELLLMRADKMSMATSVEARVPFLDYKFVEFALNIPQKFKYKDSTTKYILKKFAETVLPYEIVYRNKVGFSAPTAKWFNEGKYFRPYFFDLISSKRNSLREFMNVDAIMGLYNKMPEKNYADQLWVLQNIVAHELI